MSGIGKEKIRRAELHYPRHGTAWARIETVQNAVPAGPTTLTLGDLSLVGTVLAGPSGDNAPSSWVGIFVQGAGWDTALPSTRPPYQNDAGVRLKSLLTDLAIDCGNLPIVLPVDAAVGAHWCRSLRGADRKQRTGRDELNLLVRRGYLPAWWVDPLGVTRFTPRTSGPVVATARVLNRDRTVGKRVLGLESPVAFVPGGTFESATIERVVVREEDGELTLETWEA